MRAERLARLRAALLEMGVDGFVLERTDRHGSEYLPPSDERVAWLSGFTGSAAKLAVTRDRAAVFSDGRYTVQLEEEVDGSLFERCHSIDNPPAKWLPPQVTPGLRIGVDPFLMRSGETRTLREAIEARGGQLVELAENPVDRIWSDRPQPPRARVTLHDERHAGESSAEKRLRIGQAIAGCDAGFLVVTAADNIAWLLNVRGRDIPYNPLVLSFALLGADGTVRWFVDPAKLPPGLDLGNAVRIEPYEAFEPSMRALAAAGERVLADPAEVHQGYLSLLRDGGATVIEAPSPVPLAKATKNAREIEGAIAAQRRDGAAVVRFLAWLEGTAADGTVDELGAAARLLDERAEDPLFEGESFPAISAFGANAALPHYRVGAASNRRLERGSLYLIDSGGQYRDGTTDITRTIAIGEPSHEMRQRFTLVLKGHIAIATAVFPEGTSGAQLDSFARAALWRHGLDFDHGTGHGVGSYLCVHEGPQRIARTGMQALVPGMIVSNEPGYYKVGHYGIRIENLELVQAMPMPDGGERPLLGFKSLTLCPIDRRLIDRDLLSPHDRAWIDGYHARVRAELGPHLEGDARRWLEAQTRPL